MKLIQFPQEPRLTDLLESLRHVIWHHCEESVNFAETLGILEIMKYEVLAEMNQDDE